MASPSQSRSYMSPTTSSMAKASRSVSSGDSCESLSIPAPSFLTNAAKTLPSKAVRPRVCRSASSQELASSSSSTRAVLKAFSSAPDDPGLPPPSSWRLFLFLTRLVSFLSVSLPSSRSPPAVRVIRVSSCVRYGWFCLVKV